MTRARDLSKLSNSQAFSVDNNFNVGINSSVPTATLDVRGNSVITGVLTATSFSGTVDATGLTGSPSITVTDITASGNVSVGGTLTYEDVTNIDAVGVITARSDISIADKIIHTGDTNTAIRFPAADAFTVETGGSEAIRVDSSQRLLVGTSSSPTAGSGAVAKSVFQGNTSNSAGGGYLSLQRGQSAASISSGQTLGLINFADSAGNDYAIIKGRTSAAGGSNDYPGELVFGTTSDGASSTTDRLIITSSGDVSIQNDTGKFTAGAGDDLKIYHNGSHNYIESSTGDLILWGGGTQLKAVIDAQVELYHDNSKKLETKSDGIDVTGEVQCDSLDVDGDADFEGANYDAQWDKSQNRFRINDNGKLTLGSDNDFEIYHTGSHAKVINGTGRIDIETGTGNIDFLGKDGTEAMAKFIPDGAVELYHDNSKKFETTSSGITVTGTVTDSIGSLRRVGIHGATVNFTLTTDHPGKLVRMSGSGKTIAVPQNVLSAGDMVTMFNVSSGTMTIEQGTGTTIYNAADGATGNRTVAAKGLVTLVCTASNEFVISGTQLT